MLARNTDVDKRGQSKILLSSSHDATLDQVGGALEQKGYWVEHVSHVRMAVRALQTERFDALVLDLDFHRHTWSDVAQVLSNPLCHLPVVVLMDSPSVEMQRRISDQCCGEIVVKPVDPVGLTRVLENCLAPTESQLEIIEPVHQSPAMATLWSRLRKVAESGSTVLLKGETGVGKGVLARWTHRFSKKSGPFVVADCSAMKPELIESELFGHERGAFTGAVGRHIGRLERANNGTIFLDEIAELDAAIQSRLLRFLEDGTFERVGGTSALRSNARVLAATNADLQRRAARGQFRQDLLYRLDVVSLTVPPLRQRRQDMELLSQQLLERLCRGQGRRTPKVTATVLEQLNQHDWPGNVRQLRNALERSLVDCNGKLEQVVLPEVVADTANDGIVKDLDENLPWRQYRTEALFQVEHHYLHVLLRRCEGNVSRAARAAGMSRNALAVKLQRHEIVASDYKVR